MGKKLKAKNGAVFSLTPTGSPRGISLDLEVDFGAGNAREPRLRLLRAVGERYAATPWCEPVLGARVHVTDRVAIGMTRRTSSTVTLDVEAPGYTISVAGPSRRTATPVAVA